MCVYEYFIYLKKSLQNPYPIALRDFLRKEKEFKFLQSRARTFA